MPFIEKKYPTYESYTKQQITDIFPAGELNDALKLKASVFTSCYIENTGKNQFRLFPLPREAQFSPVYAIGTGDFNNDGKEDMILAGNFFASRIKFGKYDANKGLLLEGDGRGTFTVADDLHSGFRINGEVRDIKEVRLASGKNIMVFALNNDSVKIYGDAKNK
jgi:hypothetical protein